MTSPESQPGSNPQVVPRPEGPDMASYERFLTPIPNPHEAFSAKQSAVGSGDASSDQTIILSTAREAVNVAHANASEPGAPTRPTTTGEANGVAEPTPIERPKIASRLREKIRGLAQKVSKRTAKLTNDHFSAPKPASTVEQDERSNQTELRKKVDEIKLEVRAREVAAEELAREHAIQRAATTTPRESNSAQDDALDNTPEIVSAADANKYYSGPPSGPNPYLRTWNAQVTRRATAKYPIAKTVNPKKVFGDIPASARGRRKVRANKLQDENQISLQRSLQELVDFYKRGYSLDIEDRYSVKAALKSKTYSRREKKDIKMAVRKLRPRPPVYEPSSAQRLANTPRDPRA